MKITAIKQQVKRKDRYSIYVDGAYAFSLSEGGLIDSRLASGQELDTAGLAALKKTAGLDKAYGNALRYVAMRPRSEWEVATYLQRKEVDPPAAAQIIARLQSIGLLSDVDFARAWVANRRLLKSISKRRLLQELRLKRVSDEAITHALAEDQTDERDSLRALVAKKRNHSKYQHDPMKFMQYLARQGFSYDDIKAVLAAAAEDEA